MTALDIYDILRYSGKFTHLKFSDVDLQAKYEPFAEIKYYINKEEYTIYLTDSFRYVILSCTPYSDIKSLDLYIFNSVYNFNHSIKNVNSIISKFKTLLEKINKLDIHIQNRNIDKISLKTIINNYIKKTYDIDEELTFYMSTTLNKNHMTINFPSLNKRITNGNSYNNNLFNTSKEKYSNYIIDAHFKKNFSTITLNFYYDGELKKLYSTGKFESYQPLKNDITKIIRKEKLINLMTNE